MKQIIEKLKEQIANSIEYGNDLDAASWGMQEGVLITANEARQIVEALEGKETVNLLSEILEYIDSLNGKGHDFWWTNSRIRDKVYFLKMKMLKDLSAKELEDDVNRNKI